MWLDESDLRWSEKDRNIYTAHEIGQIVPLVNKNLTYEKFINKNKWIFDYWPNVVKIQRENSIQKSSNSKVQRNILNVLFYLLCRTLEPLARNLQYRYMRGKITREVITPTRAVFHPKDQGLEVIKKLNKYGIF
jgi:hypothetical protein